MSDSALAIHENRSTLRYEGVYQDCVRWIKDRLSPGFSRGIGRPPEGGTPTGSHESRIGLIR
jgi:hypothetical protein